MYGLHDLHGVVDETTTLLFWFGGNGWKDDISDGGLVTLVKDYNCNNDTILFYMQHNCWFDYLKEFKL